MHPITLKAAFEAYAQLERAVEKYERDTGVDIYDATLGQGSYERQEIVYEVAKAINANVAALVNSERYALVEIVYSVGQAIADALMASLDETCSFDEVSTARVLNHGFAEGKIMV